MVVSEVNCYYVLLVLLSVLKCALSNHTFVH